MIALIIEANDCFRTRDTDAVWPIFINILSLDHLVKMITLPRKSRFCKYKLYEVTGLL